MRFSQLVAELLPESRAALRAWINADPERASNIFSTASCLLAVGFAVGLILA